MKRSLTMQSVVKSQWTVIWHILTTLCIPIAIPYAVYRYFSHLTQKRNRGSLPGKVVVITGASSGLGESMAHTFYKAGCRVVLASRRKDELERVRKDLLELHSTTPTHPPIVVPLDLTDINSLPQKVADILEVFGHIDILVNNGGISIRADAITTAVDVDIKVMLVNYFGSVAISKAVLPSMIARRQGRIVNISSVQGRIAIPHRSAYSASKHALQAFSDSLRAEMAEHNVKVTVLSPGYIKTALSLNALTGSGQNYGKNDPTTESGAHPDDVAEDVLRAILRDEREQMMCSIMPKLAFGLRFLSPNLYFWVMERRAKRLAQRL